MRHFKIRRLGLFLLAVFWSSRLLAVVPTPSVGTNYSLDYWSFGDTNTWSSFYGFTPLSYTNVNAAPLMAGMSAAVFDDPANPAWLQYNVWETDGTNNLALNAGSVTFWFAPFWTSQNQGGSGLSTNPAQSLAISNYSFEFPSTATWTSDGIPGWTFAGTAGGGVFLPTPGEMGPIPDGAQAGYINADGTPTTASQTLPYTLQADSTYILNIAVGGYASGIYNPGTNYSVSLYAGTNLLASVTPVTPPLGAWTNLQAIYTTGDYVPLGQSLTIVIGSSATQLDFDNVQLIVTPAAVTPPVQQMTISNYSFEFPSTSTWTSDGIPGWTFAGTAGGGVFLPTPGEMGPIPDGIQAGYINADGTATTATQTLTNLLQPDFTYTLSIAVGGYSSDIYNPGTNYTVSLYAGTNWLASVTPVSPPLGSWTNLQATYTSGDSVPTGQNLTVVIGSSSTQLDFDNVQLTAQPLQGVSGRLLEVGEFTTNANYGWWSIYLDNLGNNLYLSAQDGSGNQANYLAAPVSFASNMWHMAALTWSSTSTALYFDGVIVTNGPGVSVLPSTQVQSNGFWIGSDSAGWQQAQGQFAAITTYNYPLGTNDIYSAYALSQIFFLMNEPNIHSATPESEVVPTFEAITGPGYLVDDGTNSADCVTSSNIWITNASITLTTNGAVNLTFSIEGGSNGVAYDVFATPELAQPVTNAPWAWMGQGYHCSTYTIPGLTNQAVFLMLGTPQDTDHDGLTDAYELLVSHTDPNNPDTSGDGMLDGWKVLWGLNPLVNNPAQSSTRANYTYDLTSQLDLLTGIRSETITDDFEGNVLNISQ
jgi:hypothetical protein